MARAFVLIDATPHRTKDVFESLGKVSQVVGRRILEQRVGQGDILALLEDTDQDALERLLANELRSLNWVHNVIRVQPHHTVLAPVQRLMAELTREADQAARRPP